MAELLYSIAYHPCLMTVKAGMAMDQGHPLGDVQQAVRQRGMGRGVDGACPTIMSPAALGKHTCEACHRAHVTPEFRCRYRHKRPCPPGLTRSNSNSRGRRVWNRSI
jgi:hypothetical protein